VGDLDDILHDLEPSLGLLDGEPVPLEGGITNRNFKVSFGGDDYVVRLHGKDTDLLGISREAERLANAAAAELGIAPAVAASFEGGLVTRYISCAAMEGPEVATRAEEIGRALRRFHDLEVTLPVSFSVPDLLAAYGRLIEDRGGRPPGDDYEQARELAGRIVAALPARRPRPCHNDLLAGNLVRERPSDRVMIVDWEYAGMGDPGFDLGNLSVNNGFDEASDERLLSAYHEGLPSPAQLARLKLMRLLSDIREAAWGAMQARVSDLDFDFEGYAERHFARLRQALAGPQLAEWLTAVS
jgi:thiamine kinase-like enzyme